MFGKKKTTGPSFLEIGLSSKIIDSLTNDDDRFNNRKSIGNLPIFYKDFAQRQSQIDYQDYLLLPPAWRRWWYKIDSDVLYAYLNGQITEFLEPIEIQSPENPLSRVSRDSELEKDVFQLNEESKTRLKALTFGEIKDQREKEND